MLALALLVTTATPVAPARPFDARQALEARNRGAILPLEQVLGAVAATLDGRAIRIELDDDDGLPVYELRWLLPDGRRLEIEVDARDGRWLKLEGRRLEDVFRRPAAR